MSSETASSGVEAGLCAACGGGELRPWAAVGGSAGEAGLIPTTDRFGVALEDIVRCPACGHGQLAGFPDAAKLERAYRGAASSDYSEEQAGQRTTAAAVLEAIERFSGPPQSRELLDLGCWLGYLPVEARNRGWLPIGVEPSGFAVAYARTELGLEVIEAQLEQVSFERGRFGVVFMGDVIEHLPDARGALERAREWLAPDGVLAMTLPDAGSRLAWMMGPRWWSVIPTHVHYFTRPSMRALLGRSGFEPRAITTAPKAFSVRYYLSRLTGYSPALARLAVAGAKLTGVAEREWAPDFRDRMLVLASPGPGR